MDPSASRKGDQGLTEGAWKTPSGGSCLNDNQESSVLFFFFCLFWFAFFNLKILCVCVCVCVCVCDVDHF